jgi:arylformamidase
MKRLWDITQPIREGVPTWPGDTRYEATRTWAIGDDCPVNVSSVTLSTHTGSHADAPFHYDPAGKTAEAVDLSRYLGPCRLIDARGAGALITEAHVAASLDGVPPRVLFRTFDRFPAEDWASEFAAVDPALIEALAARGVVLIGVDSPSIDPETSKSLDAHNAIRRNDMAILEGLVLDAPPPGDYELIALPLPLAGLDASPVRAILRELS